MKNNCANCHFFSKMTLLKNNERLCDTINNKERDALIKKDEKPRTHTDSILTCYKGVWDEGIDKIDNFSEFIINKKRNNCFFYPYQNNMLFKAADELQKRQQESSRMLKSNLYTRLGLWIASGALLLNAIIAWLKLA